MILASAGSGKTFQLTNRYIALMGADLLSGKEVRPERIVAVTFTRKAAGEFFDSILTKLAKAADDPKEAAKLIPAKDDPLYPVLSKLDQGKYRELLRVFIDRMPRLFLNTLDSFFSNILRTFPAEFGLAGDFEVIDDHLAAIARQQVYQHVFKRQPYGVNDAQEEFLEAFRQATFGKEESKIRRVLDQFVEDQHEVYLQAASVEKWGNVDAVWPEGSDWFGVTDSLDALFSRLFAQLEKDDAITEKQWDFWNEFREQAPAHNAGSPLPARVDYFLKALLKFWPGILRGDAAFPIGGKKYELKGEVCRTLTDITRKLIGAELETKLKRTHGMWEILSRYEAAYAQLVRRRGQLTFQDMELILAGHEFGNDHPAPILSQIPGDDTRMRIDYRLDSQYDHWLLDEFQDTNVMQWNVIQNLVDEAVQDPEGERSLFQVGDVKQAIYSWRGGDTKLFDDIFKKYGGGTPGAHILKRDLNVSWRSGHDVIDTANLIFTKNSHFDEMGFPDAAMKRWKWGEHIVAPPNSDLPGYCGWINPQPYTDGKKVQQEDKFAVVVALLEEIDPINRGISCAILVQTNKVSQALVDYIRANSESNIPVMSEADIHIATDNPLTLALLSLLKFAGHPGDTFAWHHLGMTPFADVFENEELGRGQVADRVLREIFEQGFEACLRSWADELEKSGLELSTFSRNRAEELALAARIFDQSGSRDIDEFISYAERFTIRETDTKGAVQIMTVHKSKGLTFDAVILPDLSGTKMTSVRNNIGVKRNAERQVEWVYDLPTTMIVEADEVLSDFRTEGEAESAYENLCKFYVALTRARQANYLISEPPNKKSTSKNFIYLLDRCLSADEPESKTLHGGLEVDVIYETDGPTTNWNWYTDRQKEIPTGSDSETEQSIKIKDIDRKRPRRRTPSGSEMRTVSAAQLFSRSGRDARNYGTLVHAFFEKIEWLDAVSSDELTATFAAITADDDHLKKQALKEVETCLAVDEIRTALSKPSDEATCWLERRFEILLGEEWLSGTFDRVVIESDKATILDFKTDQISDGSASALAAKVDTYRPQLETYREVLSKMINLPPEKIETQLLFTKLKRVVTVG
ncbi:UvrD-helicase domain-containing protein [bacterium]|nr:UvrD-helicase domain-containing protein [bacterium]MDC0314499.1 UvrD-helicase domain-containing protein [bacterium]